MQSRVPLVRSEAIPTGGNLVLHNGEIASAVMIPSPCVKASLCTALITVHHGVEIF